MPEGFPHTQSSLCIQRRKPGLREVAAEIALRVERLRSQSNGQALSARQRKRKPRYLPIMRHLQAHLPWMQVPGSARVFHRYRRLNMTSISSF